MTAVAHTWTYNSQSFTVYGTVTPIDADWWLIRTPWVERPYAFTATEIAETARVSDPTDPRTGWWQAVAAHVTGQQTLEGIG